jgi:uncharacterized membrane protein YphA (DoxX/SURF4 family)
MAGLLSIWPGLRAAFAVGSGPLTARVFHLLLALVYLDAFVSLASQVELLIGSRGLLPWIDLLEGVERRGVGFWELPSVLRGVSSDAALVGGAWLGVGLSLVALAGVWPRVVMALLVTLYLGYAIACREFLAFQWDNLLIECGLLAVFLPRDRPSLWLPLLLRIVLFKVYFESGVAKWQSGRGDWADGSAMTWYYETAPIPTALAWYAHHLPEAWHHFESRVVLWGELLLPLCIFGPRLSRLLALSAFTGFQALNMATANYGFFCFAVLALHVWLVSDADLERARTALLSRAPALRGVMRSLLRALREPRPSPIPASIGPLLRAGRRTATALLVAFFAIVSVDQALQSFAGRTPAASLLAPGRPYWAPLRLVHSYHLFAQVTRDRIEPAIQTRTGEQWSPQWLRYQPGPLDRSPPFVAPHQPRVDFRLWFYGLSFRRSTPTYVVNLVQRVCNDPESVQGLFAAPLPERPEAVRVAFSRYRFTTPEQRAESGHWWRRDFVGATDELPCSAL